METARREIARSSGTAGASGLNQFLRAIEFVYLAAALFGGALLIAFSPWAASHWLNPHSLKPAGGDCLPANDRSHPGPSVHLRTVFRSLCGTAKAGGFELFSCRSELSLRSRGLSCPAFSFHHCLKTWWQKAILSTASIPLTMLGNLIRVLVLTFGIVPLGPEIALGKDPLEDPSWFHMLAGYLVFTVALGGMIVTALLLAALHSGNLWTQRLLRPAEFENLDAPATAKSELGEPSSSPKGDVY